MNRQPFRTLEEGVNYTFSEDIEAGISLFSSDVDEVTDGKV